MTRYVMEAKENFDAAFKAALLADTGPAYAITTNQNTGEGYDPVRRVLIFPVTISPVGGATTNSTGFDRWDGTVLLASGAAYDDTLVVDYYTGELSIDTGAVTFYPAFDPAQTVPATVGGAGAWRRFADIVAGPQGPRIVDPRTGNYFMHSFGDTHTCSLYYFGRGDDFAQIISPLPGNGDDAQGSFQIQGLTADWLYVQQTYTLTAVDHVALQCVPRTIQPAETTADTLLSFADFEYPAELVDVWFDVAVTSDKKLYYLSCQRTGAKDWKLHEFEPPTSAPFGGPVVGGGFTDITPWASGTGPNTNAATYTLDGSLEKSGQNNKNILFALPATGELVCITKLMPADKTSGSTDPALKAFDCTYVDVGGASFEHHPSFLTGYLKADFTAGTDLTDSAWVLIDMQEVDNYLSRHDYDFEVDYTRRQFFVTVQPVVEAAWTYDLADNHILIMEFEFVSGAAPSLVRVLDEALWLPAYAYMGFDSPMARMVSPMVQPLGARRDHGFYDAATSSWWWSAGKRTDTGGTDVDVLDPSFAYRNSLASTVQASMPFLRISLAGRRVVMTSVRIGKPGG
ncbi:hypothetical protein [Phenylobacterium sp.]|uniref:hypothetical protein n=1 Tax=Phenylobacterium sp. TaxID=1871053 RepID=UPI002FC77334